MAEDGWIRALRYLALAAVLLAAGAIAAWLLVEAAQNYGGSCSDGDRQGYQLAASGLALAAALLSTAGLYHRWRRRPLGWLLPSSLPFLIVAWTLAVLLVGCGE